MIDFMIFMTLVVVSLILVGVIGLTADVSKVARMLSEQKRERDKLRKDVDALMISRWSGSKEWRIR